MMMMVVMVVVGHRAHRPAVPRPIISVRAIPSPRAVMMMVVMMMVIVILHRLHPGGPSRRLRVGSLQSLDRVWDGLKEFCI